MYRNDWEAAVARAAALEQELRQTHATQAHDHDRIRDLTAQLDAARAELARLQGAMPNYPPPGYMPAMQYAYPPRSGTILTLGILSLVICGLLGPIAWSMGSEELKRIDMGQTPPHSRGTAQAGQICGIIASIFLIIGVVFFVFIMMAAAGSRH